MLSCATRMRRGGRHQQTDARLFMLALRLFMRASQFAFDAVRAHPPAATFISATGQRQLLLDPLELTSARAPCHRLRRRCGAGVAVPASAQHLPR
jgi:hypothetical protein